MNQYQPVSAHSLRDHRAIADSSYPQPPRPYQWIPGVGQDWPRPLYSDLTQSMAKPIEPVARRFLRSADHVSSVRKDHYNLAICKSKSAFEQLRPPLCESPGPYGRDDSEEQRKNENEDEIVSENEDNFKDENEGDNDDDSEDEHQDENEDGDSDANGDKSGDDIRNDSEDENKEKAAKTQSPIDSSDSDEPPSVCSSKQCSDYCQRQSVTGSYPALHPQDQTMGPYTGMGDQAFGLSPYSCHPMYCVPSSLVGYRAPLFVPPIHPMSVPFCPPSAMSPFTYGCHNGSQYMSYYLPLSYQQPFVLPPHSSQQYQYPPERHTMDGWQPNMAPLPQMPVQLSSEPPNVENGRNVRAMGTSCHQCKIRRSPHEIVFCTKIHITKVKKTPKRCQKKFCRYCLKRCYNEEVTPETFRNWVCPCCRNKCLCYSCRKKRLSSSRVSHLSGINMEVHGSS